MKKKLNKNEIPLRGLGWLHKNQFFEKTPISGWNFIYQSKTRKEVVFWYVVCLSFLAAALVSATLVYVNYSSHYTRSKVKFHMSTKLVPMPNMTLQLRLPILEFLPHVHLPYIYNHTIDFLLEYASSLHIASHLQMLFIHLCPPILQEEYFHELSAALLERAELQSQDFRSLNNIYEDKEEAYSLSVEKLSASENLKHWNETIEEYTNKFRKFWKNLLSMSAPEQARHNVTSELRDLADGPLRSRPNDSLQKLLLLKAAKNNSSQQTEINNIEFILRDVINDLRSVIHIASSQSKLVWRDWVLNKMESTRGEPLIDQMFEFDIVAQTGTKYINLDVYSYIYMWQQRLIEVMTELVIESGISPKVCDGYSDFQPFVQMFTGLYLNLKTTLLIGDVTILPIPAYVTNVYVTPAHHFTSLVDNCLMSNTACLDDCKTENYIMECDCLPWTLAMVNFDKRRTCQHCGKHCPLSTKIEKRCQDQCRKLFKHPCNHTLYHAATHVSKNIMSNRDPRIIGLDISLPNSHNFVQSIEEYEMTFSAFLSQIGGALEFWSGINVICIIHLLVFIIMQLKDSNLLKKVLLKLFKPDETTVAILSHSRQLGEVEEEFDGFIKRIRKRMYNLFPLLDDPEKQSKQSWIRNHPFFNETPMVGYKYMTVAEHWGELLFWMMTIIALIAIATINVKSSLKHFLEHPTRTIITPSMSLDSKEIAMQNMTLAIHLPLFILNDFKISPIYDPDTKLSVNELKMLYNNVDIGLTVYDLDDILIQKWRDTFFNNTWPKIQTTYENYDLTLSSNPHGYNPLVSALDDGLQSLHHFSATKNHKSWKVVQNEIFEHMWSPLLHKSTDLGLELIMLRSLMMDAIELNPTFRSNNPKSTKQVLKEQGVKADQLLAAAYKKLNQLIYIGIDPIDSETFLTDIWFEEVEFYVVLQANILLPQQTSEVKIEIYALAYNWLLILEEWLMGLKEMDEFYYLAQINSVDLISTGLSEMACSFAKATVSGIKGQFGLPPLVFSEYDLHPKWRLHSHTEDCEKEKFERCFEQCHNDGYLRECQCYPMMLHHMNRHSKHNLCQEPCANTEEILENCTGKCTDHCEAYVLEVLPNNEMELDIWDSSKIPLITGRFKLAKNLYPQVTVEYQLTAGELFGQLGGVLDFWIGLNLLAVIHLVVYIVKRFTNLHKAMKHVVPQIQLSKASKLQEEISNLRKEIASEFRDQKEAYMKVKRAKKNNDTGMNKLKDKFNSLRKNQFFATTSLTGFNFVVVAKTILEAAFWLLLICLFFVFTYISVVKVAKDFQTRRTELNAHLPTDYEHLEMGNLSLEFGMLLINFLQVNPTSLLYNFDGTNADTIAKQIACSHDIDDHYHIQSLAEDMLIDWMDMLKSWKQLFIGLKDTKRPFYGKRTLDEWRVELNEGKANLTKYLHSKGHETMPKKAIDKAKVKEEVLTILNGPMQRGNYMAFRFMLLESLKKGKDPWKKFYGILANKSNHAFLTQLMPLEPFPNHITGEYQNAPFSPNMLFDTVLHDLSHMINVHAVGAPGVKVFLQDWEYKPSMQYDDFHVLKDQSYKLMITVPSGIKEFTLEVRSFMQMWHYTVLAAIYDYFSEAGLKDIPICGYKDIREIISKNADYLVNWKLSTFDTSQMQLTFDGDSVQLYPHLQHFELTLVPTINYRAETNSCYQGSLNQCQDECMREAHLTICRCVPWTLKYLEPDTTEAICKEPCKVALELEEQCSTDCESKLLYPCKLMLYTSLLQSVYDYTDENGYRPMYSCKIMVQKTMTHIVYVESYEMSFSGFIGQLGGLLDLWLGINLLSVIHLIVFIIKMFISKSNSKNQAKSTDEMAKIEQVKQKFIGELDELSKQIQLQIIKIKPHSTGFKEQSNSN